MVSKAVNISVSVLLLLGGALCSGLNLGMLSIDPIKLKDQLETGNQRQTRQAKLLIPLVNDRHMIIVVILLGNALCMELMPILLERIIGFTGTIIISTIVVVIFCEIIPQGLMTKYKMELCGIFAPFVWFIIFQTFILSYPLARILDLILGKEDHEKYSREELVQLIAIHSMEEFHEGTHQPQIASRDEDKDLFICQAARSSINRVSFIEQQLQKELQQAEQQQEKLTYDEVSVVCGILKIHEKVAKDIYTPLDQMYMLDYNKIIESSTFSEIYENGYSRVPIYLRDRNNIVGVLLTKQLIKYSPLVSIDLRSLDIRSQVPLLPEQLSLIDVLHEFQKGSAHMGAVVSDKEFKVIGFITLEQVLEQILQEEIFDEYDVLRETRKQNQK
ncbi:Transmembrane domain-containing protein [Spironucleus salmonicida]|uniref:Transmembrane domain-containing protein n=1 Tax=Spironucleus salmonicida TaxID=348837 RepID=V6LIW4_9EUKA|nr:Transmembrane domain-containing protein [Spironucleus salmonicida]|eukprot:EST43656.1 Transmembrane domain-containing protein [Spironucleus salmonicida]